MQRTHRRRQHAHRDIAGTLGTSFSELVEGARHPAAMLNNGDRGLLRSLDTDADWAANWKKTTVSDERADLRTEAARWLDTLRTPREVREIELNGMVGSIAHLAYHRGAIRQIDSSSRGPAESTKSG